MHIVKDKDIFSYKGFYSAEHIEIEKCELCGCLLDLAYIQLRKSLSSFTDAPMVCCTCYKLWKQSKYQDVIIDVNSGYMGVWCGGELVGFTTDMKSYMHIRVKWDEAVSFVQRWKK